MCLLAASGPVRTLLVRLAPLTATPIQPHRARRALEDTTLPAAPPCAPSAWQAPSTMTATRPRCASTAAQACISSRASTALVQIIIARQARQTLTRRPPHHARRARQARACPPRAPALACSATWGRLTTTPTPQHPASPAGRAPTSGSKASSAHAAPTCAARARRTWTRTQRHRAWPVRLGRMRAPGPAASARAASRAPRTTTATQQRPVWPAWPGSTRG